MNTKSIYQLLGLLYSIMTALVVSGLAIEALISPSLNSILGVALAFVFFYPLKFLYQNFESLGEQTRSEIREEKSRIVLTLLLFTVSSYSFLYGRSIALIELLNLSFRASTSVFFPLKLFYSDISGFLGTIVFDFGRFYFHLFVIYMISGFATSIYSKITGFLGTDGKFLQASVVPFAGSGGSAENRVEVYVVTGFHGLIWIPESFCRECHLFVNVARKASENIDSEVDIQVKSYWSRFLRPLLKGGYHPPVMLVNGELVAQGYDVPDPGEIEQILE